LFVFASSQFGSKILPIKPVIKFVPKLLADRDKTVRDEAKLLAVEMYRWAGNAIMPQLQSVTPLIMTELEEAFKDIKEGNAEKARQTRFLRSQQDLKEKMEAESETGGAEAASGEAGENGGGQEEEALDPYDLLEPFDVLSKLPKDFKDKLVSDLSNLSKALHSFKMFVLWFLGSKEVAGAKRSA
jgi:cytoskeleton-associated protein 5